MQPRRSHRWSPSVSATALVGVLLVAACGGGTTVSVSPSPAASWSPSPDASQAPGAGPSSTVASSTTGPAVSLDERTFTFGGDARRVRVYRPQTMPAGKVPLL